MSIDQKLAATSLGSVSVSLMTVNEWLQTAALVIAILSGILSIIKILRTKKP